MTNRIKELREKRGITQMMLAEMSGVSLAQIQRLEYGKCIPRVLTLMKIADALNASIADMWP